MSVYSFSDHIYLTSHKFSKAAISTYIKEYLESKKNKPEHQPIDAQGFS